MSTPTPPSRRRPRRVKRPWWNSPTALYGLITFGLTAILALTMILLGLDLLTAWLAAITGVTFFTFGYDKAIAGSRAVRVPENILFALVFCGGTLGALLARPFFHHKTSKFSFRVKFWAVVGLQLVVIIIYYVWLKPWLGW